MGRLTKKADPKGADTLFGYNLRGDLTSVAVGAGGSVLGEIVATRALFSRSIVGNSLKQPSILQAELRGVAAGGALGYIVGQYGSEVNVCK